MMTENNMNDLCHAPEAESFAECMGVTDGPGDGDDETGDVASEIKLRIAELEAVIEPLQRELDKMKRQLLEMSSKYKAGDIITWNGGKRRGMVLEIRRWCGNDFYYVVRNIRKDGTEGEKAKVYSYMMENDDGDDDTN